MKPQICRLNAISSSLGGLILALLSSASAAQTNPSAWIESAGHRWRPLRPRPADQQSGFQRHPSATSGVLFTNYLSEPEGAANRTLYNGSGVATGDVDGDGLPDIFLASLAGQNQLFRNLGGGQFSNITAVAGFNVRIPQTRGAVLADLNGDRSLDLLLAVNGRGALCYTNDGQGHFTDVTVAARTGSRMGSTSLALADVDGNGTIDLYVVNYRTEDIRDRGRVRLSMVGGRPFLRGSETNRLLMLNGKLEENGQADQLYLNDGQAHFTAVPWTSGFFLDALGKPLTEAPLDWGMAAGFRDLNGDGAPDLYVCNDYWSPDRLWWNDGHGHFRAADSIQLRKTSASSMGVAFGDVDRDGLPDFLVVDMLSRDPQARKRQLGSQVPTKVSVEDRPQVMRNTLFLNRGEKRFSEIAPFARISASDWSWSPLFLDVNLDGYEDLLIGAGHFRDVQDSDAEAAVGARQRNWDSFKNEQERQQAFTAELQEHYRLYPRLDLPIVAFRNRGNSTFEEVTDAWGLNHLAIHHGMAVADFDGDGLRDLVVNVLNGPAELYRGRSEGKALVVRLRGRAPNTCGIGARVTLRGGAMAAQTTEMTAGGGYESGSDPEVTFAAGESDQGLTLEVLWRQGNRTEISDLKGGRLYEIEEPAPLPLARTNRLSMAKATWFTDASSLLAHRHIESGFDDFQHQPLLPMRLSEFGPRIGWWDPDGDGGDHLFIGSALGNPPTLLQKSKTGPWSSVPLPFGLTATDDLSGIAVWPHSSGTTLLWGVARYENGGAGGIRGLQWNAGRGVAATHLPVLTNGVSAVALADISGKGDWVLFAGGGPVLGAYPRAQSSELFRWFGGQWHADQRSRVVIQSERRIGGAVWTDLTGDGQPELVVTTDWGPIRVFQDRAGALFEITTELGLNLVTGLWRGVAAGDFNGDGKMDLIAMNWGLNSVNVASPSAPLVLAYGETSQPGITDIFETEWVAGQLSSRHPWKGLIEAVPYLGERFSAVAKYASSSLDLVLGERAPLTRRIQVTSLESQVFIQTDKGFVGYPLPRDAQLAPASAVAVADFDGDGYDDVFLAQNDFGQPNEEPRIDAGAGLVLKGNGTGGFTAVSGHESGIEILGQQRGCAVGDFNNDRKTDLVITQTGGATRLFQNQGARPGLRIRLVGDPSNPRAIGAQFRLRTQSGLGPVRELHAGSGSGSQDSLVPILTASGPLLGIWIRWPGGAITETSLPPTLIGATINIRGQIVGQ